MSTVQVELLNDGGYGDELAACVGKVFNATPYMTAFELPVSELVLAGYTNLDGQQPEESLHFYASEVRVLDGK